MKGLLGSIGVERRESEFCAQLLDFGLRVWGQDVFKDIRCVTKEW